MLFITLRMRRGSLIYEPTVTWIQTYKTIDLVIIKECEIGNNFNLCIQFFELGRLACHGFLFCSLDAKII